MIRTPPACKMIETPHTCKTHEEGSEVSGGGKGRVLPLRRRIEACRRQAEGFNKEKNERTDDTN